jgi:DNA-directed RNA polymerase subunit RPC12/RpoP
MNIQENIYRIKEVMGLKEEYEKPLQALIEILSPLAFMDEKYRFQIVPYWKTQQPKIYIKKGSAGSKTISTDNIKIHKVFPDGEMSEYDIKNYIHQLSQDSSKEKESGEKWIKCKNCNKKFTQTIHKGKKSLPICPYCGTHNN